MSARTWLATVAWSLFVFGYPLSARAAEACEPWAARAVSIQGSVEMQSTGRTDWQAIALGTLICPGDSVRVGENSRAGLSLPNQTVIRLDQNSFITLPAVKKEETSLLDLLRGAVHFISRVPRALEIKTPYVNAAIEGTEFSIRIEEALTRVVVFEGTVRAQNSAGQETLTAGEAAVAPAGQPPRKVLLAQPRDAVQWALYYPPILDPQRPAAGLEGAEAHLHRAARFLSVGRVNEAQAAIDEALALAPDSGEAQAMQAIIALVLDDKDAALRLADTAVERAPDRAAPLIARSYVHQSRFALEPALADAEQAVTSEPDHALAWARLAELQLSLGRLNAALEAASRAVELDPELSRTQSILGYAYLLRLSAPRATERFRQAIELDQSDPLPRLGLGLAEVRRGNLEAGREQMEIAAGLDPNQSLIRSYLGKAYFEERRNALAASQFDLARSLDPLDPTPWFYDAIRKQTENRPSEALEDLQQSTELNDNRAVYRSRLMLDQDLAARQATTARIYDNLGFTQLGVNQSTRSLSLDPGNHSAHRFLADNHLRQPRLETARNRHRSCLDPCSDTVEKYRVRYHLQPKCQLLEH